MSFFLFPGISEDAGQAQLQTWQNCGHSEGFAVCWHQPGQAAGLWWMAPGSQDVCALFVFNVMAVSILAQYYLFHVGNYSSAYFLFWKLGHDRVQGIGRCRWGLKACSVTGIMECQALCTATFFCSPVGCIACESLYAFL